MINVVKEPLCLNRVVCEKKEIIFAQDDMIVPDSKPDILNTICTSGVVCIYKKEVLEGNMDVELLKNAMLELNKRMSYQKPINTRITRKEISVEERKEYIREYISKRGNVKFTDLFEEYSKDLVVATFLSILDMCKQRRS